MTTWDDQNNDARRQAGQGMVAALWSVRTLRSLGILSVVGLASVMGACAESAAGPSPAEFEQTSATNEVSANFHKAEFDSESFTTEGKPTKTVETPNGVFEVYDIENDPNITQAIEVLFERGDMTFGDISNSSLDYTSETWNLPELKYLRAAHSTSFCDLKRMGCRFVQKLSCESYHQVSYVSPAGLKYLGKPGYSLDELSENALVGSEMTRNMKLPIFKEDLSRGRWRDSELFEDPRIYTVNGQSRKSYGFYPVPSPCDNSNHYTISKRHFFGNDYAYSISRVNEIYASQTCEEWTKFHDQ